MLLMARCARNLYECTAFQQTTLIRLYEFLKNSRMLSENLLIDTYRQLSKHSEMNTLLCMSEMTLNS